MANVKMVATRNFQTTLGTILEGQEFEVDDSMVSHYVDDGSAKRKDEKQEQAKPESKAQAQPKPAVGASQPAPTLSPPQPAQAKPQ